jgi:CRISPR-associated protein Cmr5
MRTIEKLIPFAIDAVKNKMEEEMKTGVVNKAYKGYISSLGAGIIQSGLLPTLAMYKGAEKSENKKADTGKLLDAIFYVIVNNHEPDVINEKNLFSYALQALKAHENRQTVINEIMNASIAIKLAIRTFKLEDL